MATVDRPASVSTERLASARPVQPTPADVDRRALFGGGVLSRVLVLFGSVTLVSNAAYLIGYHLSARGMVAGEPDHGRRAGRRDRELLVEIRGDGVFNIGVMVTLIVLSNLNRVRDFPVGYLLALSYAVTTGLVSGTNSFVASDLTRYTAREGMALGLGIGGLETLGFVLITVATVPLGIYQYRSWWR